MGTNDFSARLERIQARQRPVETLDVPPLETEEIQPEPREPLASETVLPPEEGRGGGLVRIAAWVGLLTGVGAMGAVAAAILFSDGAIDPRGTETAFASGIAVPELAPPYSGPAWWDGDRNVAAIFGPELNRTRQVAAYLRVPAEELPEGSARNSEASLATLATDHGTPLFEGRCAEMRKMLAAECALEEVRADPILDGRYVDFKATFMFAPSQWIGSAELRDGASLHKADFELTDGAGVPDTAQGREEIYARAVALCGSLRMIYGNCGIERIALSSVEIDGKSMAQGKASFRVYADESEVSRQDLSNHLVAAWNTRERAVAGMRMMATLFLR